tara:strand:- start:3477 stop:5399 length:1923 start_codon:yes stop_codon:yes gene_type:complete
LENLQIIDDYFDTIKKNETIDDVVWSIVKNTISKFDFTDCVIYLVDKTNESLVQRAAIGKKNPESRNILNPIKIKIGEGIVGNVAKSKTAEIINNTKKDHRYIIDDESRLSEITVPIVYEGLLLGVIDSENSQKDFYTSNHLNILNIVATIAATKIIQTKYYYELRKSQFKLKRMEFGFKELFEKSGDAMTIIENGIFVNCNKSALEMFGFSKKANLLNCHPKELSPEFQEDGKKSDDKALEMMLIASKNGSHRFEWNHENIQGETFPIEVLLTNISNSDDKVIFHSVSRNITERKKSEQKLIQREKRFRYLSENSLEITCITNQKGIIEFITSAVTKLLGFNTDDLIGQNIFNYIHKEDKSEAKERFKIRSEEGGKGEYRIFKVKMKSGKYKHLRIITSNHFSEPSINGFVINAHDVSDIIKAEKEKYIAIFDTKENERNRISHDLHDGLGQTIAAANMHLNYLDPELKKQIDKETYKTFKTTLNLVNDATQETRTISHNFMPRSLKRYGLEDAITNLIKQYQNINKEIKLELTSTIKNYRFTERIEISIFRIIQELLSNALKHSKSDIINVVLDVFQEKLFLAVSDNGIGFDVKKVVEDKKKGLGLTSLKQRIIALDGKLIIKSNKNRGTSISVIIKI